MSEMLIFAAPRSDGSIVFSIVAEFLRAKAATAFSAS